MSDPVFTTVYSGSRILELSEPEKSNKLSISTLGTLSSLIHKYDDNLVISALFFSSSSPEIFSNGIDDIDIRDNKELLFKEIKKVIEAISRSTKETLAVFDGECDGTAYAIFSSSKYLLGTPSTDIRVTDLSKGRMPLGGLAYRFVKGCDEGVEAARYYALSQASIYGNDAFSLGLVTHLVGESPQHILAHGLSHTIPPSPKSRNIQGAAVDISSLPLLVESMHAECSLDVIDDEIWNEVCLVTPEREREIFSNEENEREDAYTLSKDIHYCFSVNSPEESVLRLHSLLEKHNSSLSSSSSLSLSSSSSSSSSLSSSLSLTQHWTENALHSMFTLHPLVIKVWYKLTRLAVKSTLSSVIEIEERVNSKLLELDLLESNHVIEKYSKEQLIARLQSVSQDQVDALFLSSVVPQKKKKDTKGEEIE
eukprot:CAMPEP_0182419746 /NCGR_PEP_ID=MMETSP1167-20130531/4128_1 /TAXON_ID=2988 /ORGANISM="Mallomonas Sp, Strain CCMP3275" /LENGTH=423 /DNA_ID=CAMNT_0024594823 /DNA_START=181 /DNA_END=1452 /DNA_ORIENTATION=+